MMVGVSQVMAIQAATLNGLPINHYPYPYYYGHTDYPAEADLCFHHLHFNLCRICEAADAIYGPANFYCLN